MAVSKEAFRAALGRFASGVTVVTTRDASGRPRGVTVASFASLSLVPPRVVVCIGTTSRIHDVLREAGRYVVNNYQNDGNTADVNGGAGFGLGRGSLALFGEVLDRQPTNRAWADKFEDAGGAPDSIDSNGQVLADNMTLAQLQVSDQNLYDEIAPQLAPESRADLGSDRPFLYDGKD